jgi:hypothetical protein
VINSFRVGDEIPLADGPAVLVSCTGGVLVLRAKGSGETIQLAPDQLAERLESPDTRCRFDDYLAYAGDEARDLAAHLEEVQCGTPLIRGESVRAEYDPATTTLEARIAAKARELGAGFARATLKRKLAAYRTSGLVGLVDKRKARADSPLARADQRVIEAMTAVMDADVLVSTGTMRRLSLKVEVEMSRRFPDQDVPLPSRTTLWKYATILGKGRYVLGNAANRRTVANRPSRMFSSRPAFLPGQEVQIDSSPFDIVVLDHTGKPQRAVLTIMYDKATGSITASSALLKSAKGVDHAILLARCMVPRQRRPNTNHWTSGLPAMPDLAWKQLLPEAEQVGVDASRPYIVPQRIVTDNGADFISTVFRDACARFGISITEASTHTPTDKANVERAFGSIRTGFAQYLPGFTGGSVDRRGHRPEDDDGLVDIITLTELFDIWVTRVWQHTRQDGLADPVLPGLTHSPNTMFEALTPYTGLVPLSLGPHDYIGLLPIAERSIQPDGIHIGYRVYDSPHLGPYRLRPSNDARRKGKWAVRYDPYDPCAVWIRDPEDASWVACEWVNRNWRFAPHADAVRHQALQVARENPGLDRDEAARQTLEILQLTPRAKRQVERATSRALTAVAQRESVLPAPEKADSVPEPPEPTGGIRIFDPEDYA